MAFTDLALKEFEIHAVISVIWRMRKLKFLDCVRKFIAIILLVITWFLKGRENYNVVVFKLLC